MSVRYGSGLPMVGPFPSMAAMNKYFCGTRGAVRCADVGPEVHKTFGRSGHTKSQRSCMLCASRFGQSPFSCSFHFIMLPLRPYFSMSLRDVIAALAAAFGAFDTERVERTLDVTKTR